MTKTLRQIIVNAFRQTGGRGDPPLRFIRTWREQNPAWGEWSLGTTFRSGSPLATRPSTALDQATEEWLETFPDRPPRGAEFEKVLAKVRAANEELEAATGLTNG